MFAEDKAISIVYNRKRKQSKSEWKWNPGNFQSMLEYKLKWLGLPVRCVDPGNSSIPFRPMVAHGWGHFDEVWEVRSD